MNGHDSVLFNKDVIVLGYCLSLYKFLKRMQRSGTVGDASGAGASENAAKLTVSPLDDWRLPSGHGG